MNFVTVGRVPAFALQNQPWDSLRPRRWSLGENRNLRSPLRPGTHPHPGTIVDSPAHDESAEEDAERWDGLA